MRTYLVLLLLVLAWHAAGVGLAIARGPVPALAAEAPAAAETRPGWRYELRAPELLGNATPAPQGLTFLDESTLLLATASRDVTVLYRIDVASRRVTGRAASTDLTHLNSLRTRSNGEVWAAVHVLSRHANLLMVLDIEASFRTGAIVARELRSFGNWGFSVAFAEADGVEYVLCQQWAGSSEPRLEVLRAADLVTVQRLDLGLRIQDVAVSPADGLLYVSRNTARDGRGGGWIETYDVQAALAAPDGARLAPAARYPHATRLAEGIAFRPGDGRLWGATEGKAAVGDAWAFSAVWSSTVAELAAVR